MSSDPKQPQRPPGKYQVIDPAYRGVSPDASLLDFKDPRNRKRAGVPNIEVARLDPNWSEFNTD